MKSKLSRTERQSESPPRKAATNTTVESLMTRQVVAVNPETRFESLVKVLDDNRIAGVPVVSKEGQVIGVVSEGDLVLKLEHSDRKMASYWRAVIESSPREAARRLAADLDKAIGRTAHEIMTAPAITIHPDASSAEAAHIMHTRQVNRLPVVDADGRLVGIVSRGDLLKALIQHG